MPTIAEFWANRLQLGPWQRNVDDARAALRRSGEILYQSTLNLLEQQRQVPIAFDIDGTLITSGKNDASGGRPRGAVAGIGEHWILIRPGAVELLERLRLSGFVLGVCTAATRSWAEAALRALEAARVRPARGPLVDPCHVVALGGGRLGQKDLPEKDLAAVFLEFSPDICLGVDDQNITPAGRWRTEQVRASVPFTGLIACNDSLNILKSNCQSLQSS